MKIRTIASLIVVLITMIIMTVPVWAAVLPPGNNIVNFGDTEIPFGNTVKHLLVIGGNVNIEGTIGDEVMVINGNLRLGPTASVRDHAIVLGGNLLTEEGACVGKGVFRIGGDFAYAGTLFVTGAVIAGIWIANALITAVLLIWPGIMAWLSRRLVEDVSKIIRSNPVQTVTVGGLGLMTLTVLILMLTISVVGIPAAVLLVLLGFFILAAGMGGTCHALGCYLPSFQEQGRIGVVQITFIGAVMGALLYNIPMLGFLVLLILSSAAIGGILLKVLRKRDK